MPVIFLVLLVCLGTAFGESPANWTANYPPCNRHSELLTQEHMNLGVRVATANQALAAQFRRAMNSWASIIDLDWYEDDTHSCAIQLVDGKRELFETPAVAARSQLPDRPYFQGWIAFNPTQEHSDIEMYRIALHEVGHMLGLQHSSNAKSVMYGFNLDGQKWLDPEDLSALAAHHKLRITALDKPIELPIRAAGESLAVSSKMNDRGN